MLALVKDYMKEYYYDPKYRGMDLEARFKTADAKIAEAQSLSQVLGVIAQALAELNDSHTFFIPPPRPVIVDYGWKMQAVGERVFVVAVKPGSDAEAQGLKPSDVDSESGSASEVFARVVQLEKRGTVVGDLTAGAVMMSTQRPGLLGDQSSGNMIQYGMSVTEADIIMADGQSLEHVGVTPDVLLLPTAADLRVRRDPVLARAIELAGGWMTAEKAGSLFPLEVELKSTR